MRCVLLSLPLLALPPLLAAQAPRPRARDVGLVIGSLPPGPRNAITDVAGVRVGQVTVTAGDSVNTGVTVVVPHGGNVFQEKVPAAVAVGNGYGKLTGIAQVRELGEMETPVVLTCTLCVPRAADGLLTWVLAQPGNEQVGSVNLVVGETNDGALNAIRSRPVTPEHVLEALRRADTGAVAEGSVGAGRGTVAFGWKGGIGTASRRLPERAGGWTVGVLVQSNFGGDLTIAGVRVPNGVVERHDGRTGVRTGDHDSVSVRPYARAPVRQDGSIMIVVATDAPLDPAALERLARRAFLGVARTGSSMANGSGDFAIAFSTAPEVRRGPLPRGELLRPPARVVSTGAMSPLFQAVVEATEEAVVNSLFRATTVRGASFTAEALPIDSIVSILRGHRAVP